MGAVCQEFQILTHSLARLLATIVIMRRFVKGLESSLSIKKVSEVSRLTVFDRIFYVCGIKIRKQFLG